MWYKFTNLLSVSFSMSCICPIVFVSFPCFYLSHANVYLICFILSHSHRFFKPVSIKTAVDFNSTVISLISFYDPSVPFKNYTDSLINKEYDQGCECIFKNIEWENDDRCKCQQIIYRTVYCASHFNECFDWHSKSFSVSRK